MIETIFNFVYFLFFDTENNIILMLDKDSILFVCYLK